MYHGGCVVRQARLLAAAAWAAPTPRWVSGNASRNSGDRDGGLGAGLTMPYPRG